MRLVPVELRTNTNQVEFMTGFRICWAELTWLKVHRLLLTCIKTSDRLYQKLLFWKRDGEAAIICMHLFFINNQCTFLSSVLQQDHVIWLEISSAHLLKSLFYWSFLSRSYPEHPPAYLSLIPQPTLIFLTSQFSVLQSYRQNDDVCDRQFLYTSGVE